MYVVPLQVIRTHTYLHIRRRALPPLLHTKFFSRVGKDTDILIRIRICTRRTIKVKEHLLIRVTSSTQEEKSE